MQKTEELNPNQIGNDLLQKETLRPQLLNDFIGQQESKNNLAIFINSAKQRKKCLDHTLFYGPPGLGKTTLAQIIANEMNVGFKSSAGPVISKSGDLAAILTNLKQNDVLFIDEIHRLHVSVEEILYSAMEDFKLDIVIGEGPGARAIKIDLPKFTLVAATTRLGLLANPLRDRFGIPIRLNFYNINELTEIIIRDAALIDIDIDNGGAFEIASRSRGTPRIAIRMLKRVRDFAVIDKSNIITKEIADKALTRLGVDNKGLDSCDHRYLNFIAKNFNGGPVGIETIVAGLGDERDSIEETVEPYLIQKGFLDKTPRGRMLTKKAMKHINYL